MRLMIYTAFILFILYCHCAKDYKHFQKWVMKSSFILINETSAINKIQWFVKDQLCNEVVNHHINWQPDYFSLLLVLRVIGLKRFWRTNLIASSKTPLSPYWVKALHSMYLESAKFYSTNFLAFSATIGAVLGSLLICAYSCLWSILFPTKILGTSAPTALFSSGYHLISS